MILDSTSDTTLDTTQEAGQQTAQKANQQTAQEPKITISVLYFASLADKAGCDQESIHIAPTTSLSDLFAQLDDQYHFGCCQSQLRVAINDNFAQWSDAIHDGDSIAFIPPVAGG